MNNKQQYYLGLDLGVANNGWAVTDKNYNLVKANVKGKLKEHSEWGVRKFPQADTAQERREFRCARRQNSRKKLRRKYLRDFFKDEINKIDPGFFSRLDNSFRHKYEKNDFKIPFNAILFDDKYFKDADYFQKYPTIYHLQKELIDNKEYHDPRLVFLALWHYCDHRGHFLSNIKKGQKISVENAIYQFIDEFNNIDINLVISDINAVKNILINKHETINQRNKKLKKYIKVNNYDKKVNNKAITAIGKIMLGGLGVIQNIFPNSELDSRDAYKIKFGEEDIDNILEEISALEPHFVQAINAILNVKSAVDMLAIMPEKFQYLCEAKIADYELHHVNLVVLKFLTKAALGNNKYNEFFNKIDGSRVNYANYIGKSCLFGKKSKFTKSRDTSENLHKVISSDLLPAIREKLSNQKINDILNDKLFTSEKTTFYTALNKWDKNSNVLDYLEYNCENNSLFPKLRTKENSIIPNQIIATECDKILENASNYLPFLNEIVDKAVDLDDRSVKNCISYMLSFKRPYYVGPLSCRGMEDKNDGTHEHFWMVRKEPGYIYPWNFRHKVDLEKSNINFIQRMTRPCTYLKNKKVLPKFSMLYQKYTVLNELNNIKVNGEKLSVEHKQYIFNNLYKKTNNVSLVSFIAFLNSQKWYDCNLTKDSISGIDSKLNARLSTYHDLLKIVGEINSSNFYILEDIILMSTIFDNSSNLLFDNIRRKYTNNFNNEQIVKLSKLHYSGWGNFSKEFLVDITINDKKLKKINILDALWYTQDNLMQILSKKYDFSNKIEVQNLSEISKDTSTLNNFINKMNLSPAIKRSVLQAGLIVLEITKINECPPTKIFIESSRQQFTKKGKTISRKNQLIKIYKTHKSKYKDLITDDLYNLLINTPEDKLNATKLYLYFLQFGICAYSGKQINFSELVSSNSKWDIDHIYPQSKIKDDSLDNKVLCLKSINHEKRAGIVPSKYRNLMKSTWKKFKDIGCLSTEKYSRLLRSKQITKTKIGDFINRQLVETSQINNATCELMKYIFGEDTQVLPVKAQLISYFRHNILGVNKARNLNDYHHAKDAYLAIVVGNCYNIKFTNNPYKWIKNNEKPFSFTKIMLHNIYDINGNLVWKGCNKNQDGFELVPDKYLPNKKVYHGGSIDKVRNIMWKDDILMSNKTYICTGKLFNVTKLRADNSAITVPLKKDLDPTLYGGYSSATTAVFAHLINKEKSIIIGIPIVVYSQKNNKEKIREYLDANGFSEYKMNKFIKSNTLLQFGNLAPMRIRGYTQKSNTLSFFQHIQFRAKPEDQELIRIVFSIRNKGTYNYAEKKKIITDNQLVHLYDLYIEKLNSPIYKERIANPIQNITGLRNEFLKSDFATKIIALTKIHNTFSTSSIPYCDLSDIGGKKYHGILSASSKKLCELPIYEITTSVTGLYQHKCRLG